MSIVNIPYSATILTKDDEAKTMEVAYSSEGMPTLTLGVRYPKEGETVEGVVADAAPIAQWKDSQKAYVIPGEGVTFQKFFPVESVVAETLASRKLKKRLDVDKFRDAMLGLGFTYDGHTFDSDLPSLVRLNTVQNAVNAGLPLPLDFVWRDKANVNVPTTAADLAGMVGVCIVTANTIFQTAWAKKAEIEAAVTVGQLAAVTWSDPRIDWTV